MAAAIDLSGAASLEEQAYRVGLELQKAELSIPAENRPDNTQITFDTENQNVAVSFTLDTTLTVNNGTAVIAVTPYL